MVPYLWEYRGRVLLALIFLVTAKIANVGVPLVMKEIVDTLDSKQAVLLLPLMLLLTDFRASRSCGRDGRFGAIKTTNLMHM